MRENKKKKMPEKDHKILLQCYSELMRTDYKNETNVVRRMKRLQDCFNSKKRDQGES